ncbi:MAG: hypothetical protein Q7S61_05270 [bacterium]|nr:hypothetical protein [bacterium]
MSGRPDHLNMNDSLRLVNPDARLQSNDRWLERISRDMRASIGDYTNALNERAEVISQIIAIDPSSRSHLCNDLFNTSISAILSIEYLRTRLIVRSDDFFSHSFRIRSNGGDIAMDRPWEKGLARLSQYQILFEHLTKDEGQRDIITVRTNFRSTYNVQRTSTIDSTGFTYSMSFK